MSIGLVMIVRDEEAVIERCLDSVLPLVDSAIILDTGSTDRTIELAREKLRPLNHWHIRETEWRSFGENLTEARNLACGYADWALRLDADMTVDWHENFPVWFASDPDPDVTAWGVELEENGTRWRLPLLTRSSVAAEYVGATHEYLAIEGKQRPLLGLTVSHHADGSHRSEKAERDLALLAPGFVDGDPRSTYYYADTLRCLGRTEEAIEAFRSRAAMSNTFEEERWHAEYRSAQLAEDVDALISAHTARPWRHEPLTAAARIIAAWSTSDILFHEPIS